MSETPSLKLPHLQAAQAQKHVTHNEALEILDTVVQLSVLDIDLSTPPTTVTEGDAYIINTNATLEWAGLETQIAHWRDGAWRIITPQIGWQAWVISQNALSVFDGIAWIDPLALGLTSVDTLGINASSDAQNRLTVASSNTLLTHDGDSHRVKINKALSGDTASLVFQTGYSGRAEFGTSGQDDFSVKVSADGTTWNDAISIDGATGSVSLPNTQSTQGQAGGEGALITGGAWRTTRDSSVGWMTHPNTSLASVGALPYPTFIPLKIGAAGMYSNISLFCQSGSTGETLRIALYKASPDNLIGTFAADFGEENCDSAGLKILTIPTFPLDQGLYYLVMRTSSSALTFRGGNFCQDTGAGLLSNIIFGAGIGRIVSFDYSDPWPTDMSNFSIGAGVNQIQLMGSYFCANMLVR